MWSVHPPFGLRPSSSSHPHRFLRSRETRQAIEIGSIETCAMHPHKERRYRVDSLKSAKDCARRSWRSGSKIREDPAMPLCESQPMAVQWASRSMPWPPTQWRDWKDDIHLSTAPSAGSSLCSDVWNMFFERIYQATMNHADKTAPRFLFAR